MKLFTRSELRQLRETIEGKPGAVASDGATLARVLAPEALARVLAPETLSRLLAQAEYALDCAQLLEEAVRYPAEPYGEAERLVAHLTDGFNEIWNRRRYRDGGGEASSDGENPA